MSALIDKCLPFHRPHGVLRLGNTQGMPVQQLGDSGLSVSRIGLGLAALGRPGYINLEHAADLARNYDVGVMEAHTHAVLDFAHQSGVRYFDAARSYGKAEDFLGSWLRAHQTSRGAVTVGSKWGYTYTADWQVKADKHEVKDHSLPVLQQQWKESQHHLGQFLNVYQIHSATLDSGVLNKPEVLGELSRLKSTGIKVGLTVSGPQQEEMIRQAIGIRIDGVCYAPVETGRFLRLG